MIRFKSHCVNGDSREWRFYNAEALRKEWLSEDCDLPADDDPIDDVHITGVLIPNSVRTFKDVVTLLELAKPWNTKIGYLYRDGCNYKVWNEAIVEGEITEEQKEIILDSLNEGEYFMPCKVGLPEEKFGDETEYDHDWFELSEDNGFELVNRKPTVNMTVAQLVENFSNFSDEGWENDE